MGWFMATDFRTSYEWSRQWNDEIRRIIGPSAVAVANESADQEGTDFVINTHRVSSRVRQPGYVPTYQWEITVTCARESGAKCEWDKNFLAKGSDWFFYGHATAWTLAER